MPTTRANTSIAWEAMSAFEWTKHKGWPPGQSYLTPVPQFLDMSCNGAFPISCNASALFRSITGICNNLAHPYWGATSTKSRRFRFPFWGNL